MKDVSDRTSFGAQWDTGGIRMQITNTIGTVSLSSSRWRVGKPWTMITESVDDPSRFGMTNPPTSYSEFSRIANRYACEVEAMVDYAEKYTVVHKADGGTRRLNEDTPRQRFFGLL